MADQDYIPPAPSPVRRARAGIAANSFWSAVDQVVALVGGLIASIAVARSFHPDVLGHYSYIMWLVMIASNLGRFGTPVAVRKYMAEFLALHREAEAATVFRVILIAQMGLATAFCAGGSAVAWHSVPAEYRQFAIIGVLSIAPSMLLSAYTSANMAMERFAPNAWASIVSALLNFAGILLTVSLGWGLIGLSSSLFLSRVTDLAVRFLASYGPLPTAPTWNPRQLWLSLEPELRARLLRFCAQSTFLQLMSLIVWERSEVIFLKWSSPVREITFYTMAFSLVTQATTLQRAFSSAAGSSLMRKIGQRSEDVGHLIHEILRYSALIAFPIAAGLAATSQALIPVLYGPNYIPVIRVLAIAAVFGVARAFLLPLEQTLIASDRQDLLIRSSLTASVFNIAFALLLIPPFGAPGAALCNGLSQVASILLTRYMVRKVTPFPFPVSGVLRSAASSALMGLIVYLVVRWLPPVPGLIAGIATGMIVFIPLTRLFRCVRPEDHARFVAIAGKLPPPARRAILPVLDYLLVSRFTSR